jgi:hypothetical protein
VADDPDMREFYEALLSFQLKAIEGAGIYNQVIVLGGYAAFFAIWSAVSGAIADWVVLTAGGLMLISVIVYVGWTVANMIVLKSHHERMGAELSKGAIDFYGRVAAVELQSLQRRDKLMKWWKPVVIVAGTTALASAILVTVASLATVIGPMFYRPPPLGPM